jgi:hypothetical protein
MLTSCSVTVLPSNDIAFCCASTANFTADMAWSPVTRAVVQLPGMVFGASALLPMHALPQRASDSAHEERHQRAPARPAINSATFSIASDGQEPAAS